MDQKKILTQSDKLVSNEKYLSLLKKTLSLVKKVQNDKLLKSTALSMYVSLPDSFSYYYLDLAFSVKETQQKIDLLASIFNKLENKEKTLVREEIKKRFVSIKNKKKKGLLLAEIFKTSDKDLIVFYKDEIKTLSREDLPQKSMLLLDISHSLDYPLEKEELERQALSEALSFNDARVHYYLTKLLDKGLSTTVKEQAIKFAIDSWATLDCTLMSRIYISEIARYLPSEVANKIVGELHEQIKKINQSTKDKTKVVDLLLKLANKPTNPLFLSLYQEALCVLREMKEKDKIKVDTLYTLVAYAPQELAIDFANLLLEKVNPFNNTSLIVELLISLLEKIPKEKRQDIVRLSAFLLNTIKQQGHSDTYLWKSLELLKYLSPEEQKNSAPAFFNAVIQTGNERLQADAFRYLPEHLPTTEKKQFLAAIEQIESASYKTTALSNVLHAFDDKEFICLGERLLDLTSISLDENQICRVVSSLVSDIGDKLNNIKE